MVTKSRKTLMQNPLDEIPARGKPVEKAVRPAKKTVEKTVRPVKKTVEKAVRPVKKTVEKTRAVRTTKAVRTAKTTRAAQTQADYGVRDEKPTRVQTAEQLMAAELDPSSKTLSNREEEIINDPSTPTKVLEQPGNPSVSLGGNVMTGQFLTAEDVFQNELSRERVSVKAEVTRTRLEAYKIVKRWSRWSIAASMIPTAFVDVAAISGVQVKMIHELCKMYGVSFEHKAAVAIASGVAGGAAVRTLAGVLAKQMIRWTPGVGTVFILAIEPAISYVTTNAMGLAFISHFERDGRLHDFKPEKIRQYMAAQLAKRKPTANENIKPGHA